MGVYLNPGNKSFSMAVNSQIYVDKTPMIQFTNAVLNTSQRYISVSRPRRFGKTMAADMLCAYYDMQADSRELFQERLLAETVSEFSTKAWDAHLGRFNVIRLVMTDFIKDDVEIVDSLNKISSRVLGELGKVYPMVEYDVTDFPYSMELFYRESGVEFVIVIDEWDAVFRVRREDKEGQVKYLNFLRDWLKDKTYVALAYMTGILPIKKYGQHSALNMFNEFSMALPMQLAQYVGFTESEVSKLCKEYGRDYKAIKEWYDGYDVSDIVPADPEHKLLLETGSSPELKHYALYSPYSVVKAIETGVISNYWNQTETYEALAEYIRKDFDGLKEAVALLMDGGRIRVNINKYQNDMTTFTSKDDILALLIHLGYLAYSDEEKQAYIPNKEVAKVFEESTESSDWFDKC